MKLQTVLMISLLGTLAISTQGKLLKTLLKKKLSLIPSLVKPPTSGHSGNSIGLISPQVGPLTPADNSLAEIAPLSETIQSDIVDDSSVVEEVHQIPASAVASYEYEYAPIFRTPVYYTASQPVLSRTVYQYVEAPRNDVLPLTVRSLPGLSGLSELKSLITSTLRSPVPLPATAPASSATTTYVSYPPY